MNIAIDIDDTLTESFSYFQPYVAEYYGVDISELRKENISYSNLPAEWKPQELDFCKTYYDSIVAHTPFKKDAAWAVKTLKEQGHKIIIITGRSTAFYTDPYRTTVEELRNGNIVYDKLICALDKGRACIEENIHIMIDDMPANCDAAARNGILTVLFTSNANRERKTDHLRADDWKEVINIIHRAGG